MQRVEAQVLAYCLMGNHDHFVLHTDRANLSLLMRHLNDVYTQAFERRHHAATTRWGICSKAVLRPLWWTAMPTCWRCAVMWSSNRYSRAW